MQALSARHWLGVSTGSSVERKRGPGSTATAAEGWTNPGHGGAICTRVTLNSPADEAEAELHLKGGRTGHFQEQEQSSSSGRPS